MVERSAAQAKPPAQTAKPPAAGTQKPATGAAGAKTTLSGVYTEAQVAKGEETYYNICISCHPKGTYAGPQFKTNWGGRPLSDLFDWVLNKIPKNDPGTLTPAEVAQVMAYILQQNKMPAGTALPANEKALFSIPSCSRPIIRV